jgi:hypothetical protein
MQLKIWKGFFNALSSVALNALKSRLRNSRHLRND